MPRGRKSRKIVKSKPEIKKVVREVLPRGSRNEAKFRLSEKVEEALGRLKLDPIAEMIMYAKGDVVGLGLMSQAELDAEEEFNAEGVRVRKSGHEIALELIPPSLRAKMAAELISFHFPRKKAEEPKTQNDEEPPIQVYLPDNGRTSP